MYAWFYGGSPLVVYPLVALFLFLAVFVSVVLQVLARRAARYEPLASLPLLDDETHRQTSDPGERHG